ncbi:MAG: hypothetical protein GY847_14680 [Proteobacteria bacterium]|nr:hypothetical protein [Pseudomonadota bacterium]
MMSFFKQFWLLIAAEGLCVLFFTGCMDAGGDDAADDGWDTDSDSSTEQDSDTAQVEREIDQGHFDAISQKGYDPWPEPDPKLDRIKLVTVKIDLKADLLNVEGTVNLGREFDRKTRLSLDNEGYLIGRILAVPGDELTFTLSRLDSDTTVHSLVAKVATIDGENIAANNRQVHCSTKCEFVVSIPHAEEDEIDLVISLESQR